MIGRLGSVNNVTWTINGTEITKDEDFRAAPDADFTFGLAAKPGYVLEWLVVLRTTLLFPSTTFRVYS